MNWLLLLGVPFCFFVLFGIIYKIKKVSLWAGFFFLCFLSSGGLAFVLVSLQTNNPLPTILVFIFAMVALFVLLFGVYLLIALLLLNARSVLKRERKSLANSLTLILAIGLICLTITSWVLGRVSMPVWAQCFIVGITAVLIYYFFNILLFLTTLLLCNLAHPRKNQQYIIVLGSGLVNGKVPPLLANRVEKAITFYKSQKAKKRRPPKLVLSGGQGVDEPLSEAEAMWQYATSRGVALEDALLENKAANTLENMQFSKVLIEADAGGKPYHCIYATSSYHLLRAGIYANKAGLRSIGIGAKTALYYLPNALLREYIAFWWMYRKSNFVLSALLFVFGVLLVVASAMAARAGWGG